MLQSDMPDASTGVSESVAFNDSEQIHDPAAFDFSKNYCEYMSFPVGNGITVVTYEVLVHDFTEREATLVELQTAVTELYNQGLYGLNSWNIGSVAGDGDVTDDDLVVVIEFDPSEADDDSVRAVVKLLMDLGYVQADLTSQGDYLCVVADTFGAIAIDEDGNESETEDTYAVFPIATERDFRLYELRDVVLDWMRDGTYEISTLGVGPITESDEDGNLAFGEFQTVTIGATSEEDAEAIRERLSEMGYTEAAFDAEGDFYLEISAYSTPL